MLRRTIVLFASFLTLAGTAWADVVYLRDGGRLEGSVVREGSTLTVRHRYGETQLDASEVLRIEEGDDRWSLLERKRAQLAQGTADERYRFGVFAREQGFDGDARAAFLSVLRLDLDHPGARGALGYVRHEGRWITLADRNRLAGLVLHQGDWITPEARARLLEEAALARRERLDAAAEERERRRAEREAEREAQREARLARARAYEQELARARARERAARESAPRREHLGVPSGLGGVIVNGVYYPHGYLPYGHYGITPLRARTALPYPGHTRLGHHGRVYRGGVHHGHRSGVGLSGSYQGGSWQLRWRVGY